MTGWPFGDLVPMRYGRIIADPPWYFANYSAAGEEKNPVAHYACMDLDAIKALPVGHLAAPDCALLMWATFPMLPQALETMRAWGFTYKTGGAWGKLSKTGAKVAFGTGYVLRSAAELFLIGTIGKPKIRSASVRNLIDRRRRAALGSALHRRRDRARALRYRLPADRRSLAPGRPVLRAGGVA